MSEARKKRSLASADAEVTHSLELATNETRHCGKHVPRNQPMVDDETAQ